jgi:hypothetical protein
MQRKSLVGTHMEYQFNKDFSIGGTIMHLSETPLTKKVNTGNEPISNTIWGLNTSWRGESQWLTNLLDKLPFVNATKPSSIALNAEFAQLIPGHSNVVGAQGLAYIDDFESTKTSIDLHYPSSWYLASTPYSPEKDALFPEAKLTTTEYGKNRSLFAWYYVDQILNSKNPGRTTPVNLRNNAESQSNHYTRDVLIKEVFPNKSYLSYNPSILTALSSVVFPNSLISIGNSALSQCYSLQYVDLPKTLTYIGNSAFSDCHKLRSVEIPSGISVINNNTFSSCYNLKSVKFNEGLQYITNSAFLESTLIFEINVLLSSVIPFLQEV